VEASGIEGVLVSVRIRMDELFAEAGDQAAAID
jgi:hypothetical protein